MQPAFALIAVAADVAVVLRLLTYRKNGACHHAPMAWSAWAIVAASGGAAITLVIDPAAGCVFHTAQAVLLALIVFVVDGNVARLFRRSRT
jgi:hypothetical protein